MILIENYVEVRSTIMLCFMDMSFCTMSEECSNKKCDRNFTEEQAKLAVEWWGSEDAPVCFSPFKSDTCGYMEK